MTSPGRERSSPRSRRSTVVSRGLEAVADQGMGPGTVLPNFVHGGPGKAGGGEELGGLRGMRFYQQRTAVQADRGLFERAFGSR